MKTINVPDTIPLSKIREFVTGLGLDAKYLRELNVGMDAVSVEVLALDENGKPYLEPNGDIAMHRISVRVDRDA